LRRPDRQGGGDTAAVNLGWPPAGHVPTTRAAAQVAATTRPLIAAGDVPSAGRR
jgi:hypothetical protein